MTLFPTTPFPVKDEPHPDFARESTLSIRPNIDRQRTPTADLLIRFNPKLIGFGIVSPLPCNLPGTADFREGSSAAYMAGKGNSEGRE